MLKVKENKEVFKTLCMQWIKRDGVIELLDWLEETDFYVAPASSKYHMMCEGGLCQHSINVFNRLIHEYDFNDLTSQEANELMEQLAIVALFHDLCKVNFYKVDTRNVKNEHGEWIKVPYFAVDNRGDLVGHGYKSARIVNRYMDLSDTEYMAIAYHMGYSMEKLEDVSEIFKKNKLAVLLHIADTKATFIDEKKED